MPQVRRRALNEAIFRQVNERIEALSVAHQQEQLEIVCECASLGCATPLQISLGRYEAGRRDPRTFMVAPGHNDPTLEIVVADHGEYMIVRKVGEAAEEAVITDPR